MTTGAIAPAAGRPVGVDWLALGAALLTVAFWASAFVGIRAVAPHLSPGPLALGRLVVGTAVLGLFVAARRGPMPRGRVLALLVACGLLWFALYSVALNAAERLVDAGTAAMLVNVGPILIALFGWLFLAEGLPPRLLAGLLVAFGGAVVIGLATAGDGSLGGDAAIGVALCLFAALAYAGGVTLQKPVLARVSALNVTWLACAVGAVATAPFAHSSSRSWLSVRSRPPPGSSTWACSRPRSPSRPGRSPSGGRAPGGSAR